MKLRLYIFFSFVFVVYSILIEFSFSCFIIFVKWLFSQNCHHFQLICCNFSFHCVRVQLWRGKNGDDDKQENLLYILIIIFSRQVCSLYNVRKFGFRNHFHLAILRNIRSCLVVFLKLSFPHLIIIICSRLYRRLLQSYHLLYNYYIR